MEIAPLISTPLALQSFDFLAQPHDLGLERRQRQVVTHFGKGEQTSEPLRFSEGRCRFPEPLRLVGSIWTHGYSPPLRGDGDSDTK
jgi:hypothetical protein